MPEHNEDFQQKHAQEFNNLARELDGKGNVEHDMNSRVKCDIFIGPQTPCFQAQNVLFLNTK